MEFHVETEDRLRSKIQKLEKNNEGLEKQLQNLQKESFQRLERFRLDLVSKNDDIQHLRERRGILLEERKEWELRFRSLEGEQNSAAHRLSEAKTELEARSQAALQNNRAWSVVTAMARRSAARLCNKGEADEHGEIEVDEAVRKMVKPFAEALESIERVFEGKQQEMKELRRGIEALIGKGGEEEMDFVDVGAFLTDGA